MNLGKLNDWLQVLGLFGVMASLVFVGLQMQQDRQIALAEAYSTRASISVDMYGSVTASPQFFSGTHKLYSGLRDELTGEEYVALENFFNSQLTVFENIHFQHVSGFIPASHWRKNLDDLDCHLSEPFFREVAKYWNAREDFREVLDDAIARGGKAESSCWDSTQGEPWKYFHRLERAPALTEPGA